MDYLSYTDLAHKMSQAHLLPTRAQGSSPLLVSVRTGVILKPNSAYIHS